MQKGPLFRQVQGGGVNGIQALIRKGKKKVQVATFHLICIFKLLQSSNLIFFLNPSSSN